MQSFKLLLLISLGAGTGVVAAAEPTVDAGYCVYADARYSEGATLRGADGTTLRCSRASTLVMDDGRTQLSWQPDETPGDWDVAVRRALHLAYAFHEGGQDASARDALVASLLTLQRHRFWSKDFDPGLEEKFWGAKGILRVLLTFQADRVIGFKLQDPFAVLCVGMQMGQMNKRPYGHLFLAAWDIFRPAATPAQQLSVMQKFEAERGKFEPDRRFDAIATVLFPEMRTKLRLA